MTMIQKAFNLDDDFVDIEDKVETDDEHYCVPQCGRPSDDRWSGRAPRIAFYSHDTMGMGHVRRNLLIASALSSGSCQAETLLIAGTREAGFFAEQAGVDCITLPGISKNRNGEYASRYYSWSVEETVRLRGRIISSALRAFLPDIFVVDKLPLGIGNELQRVLKMLRSRGRTHCVLGLRDVLDEPDVANREWAAAKTDDTIEECFDEVWVYGDPNVFDCRTEYMFRKSTMERIQFTGYLDQASRLTPPSTTDHREQPMALCVVGGGQDGFSLGKAFIDAGVPEGWQGILITGPFMPASDRQKLIQSAVEQSQGDRTITVIDRLVESDDYLRQATRVIAMGGYNTVMSVLSYRKPALIVPRTQPRLEQWIRADRLASANLITTVHPSALQPSVIRQWLEEPSVANPSMHSIDLSGLHRIQSRVHAFSQQTRNRDPLCRNHTRNQGKIHG